jgi:hypothetical protein
MTTPLCAELAAASVSSNDDDEPVSRICELTHQLGYNRAKTKMLLGQWASDLPGLERSLLSKLEASSEKPPILPATGAGYKEPTSTEGFDRVEEKVIRGYE